jgi:CRP/FNR family transcriptional regulator, cyclic AMP receptor protein
MARAKDLRLEQMGTVPLFSSCSKQELTTIGRASEEIRVPAGTVLVEEGQPGSEFYLILDGEASVGRNGRTMATIGPGGSFGELALLTDLPRNATVTATQDSVLLVLSQREFGRVLQEAPGLSSTLLATLARRLSEADTRSVTD